MPIQTLTSFCGCGVIPNKQVIKVAAESLELNFFIDLTIGNDVIVICELNLTQYTKNYNNTISLDQNKIWYTPHEEVVDIILASTLTPSATRT